MKNQVIHRADTRGYADHGWLKANHSFSFAGYHNDDRIHFGALRVLNDDNVAGGMGFGTHPHDNMEIVTIPLTGALEHKDSMGNHGVIQSGEIQIMSAGTGIYHSEFNANKSEPVTLFQIWVFPNKHGVAPRYQQKRYDLDSTPNELQTLVGPDVETGWVHQDAWFSMGKFEAGKSLEYTLKKPGNGAYIMVVDGAIEIDGETLNKRDAIGIWNTDKINVTFKENTRLLVIDVPMVF